ncbi:carbohydrate-responsive element-binding protein-like isoform X3 [Haliotis rufescens]|uniref:carbohydrate-responsive element-binding protein-like isoform X3 n=1 Tax=Haliotis rufescens TaxID=6454 RepID=UPI001EAFC146|nr:carbohydrate-responsive element-binding protein-like isoform X3 [Haliotis rufescens]
MAIEDPLKTHSPETMLEIQSNKSEGMKTEKANQIHSGHFMISRVHDPATDEFDEYDDKSGDSVGYDFMEATKETSQTYSFGPRSTRTLAIDASLTKLFQCLTLAYSGKITSPKWKPFRGMHLSIKDKIRLNNIIWREWHLQYVFRKIPNVCQFATPLSDDIHTKPEAVVLEGKYWKRRLDTVTAEYKKWRRYFKERVSRNPPDSQMQEDDDFPCQVATIAELLERVKDSTMIPRPSQPSATDLLITNDFEEMDFTDNLFSSLKEPFQFPNPRELSQLGCADLIQPGLIQLQPNLEDFMDVDTVHDMIMNSSRTQMTNFLSGSTGSLDILPTGSAIQSSNSDPMQTSMTVEQQLAALQQQSYSDPSGVLDYQLSQALCNTGSFGQHSSAGMGQSGLIVDLQTDQFGQNTNFMECSVMNKPSVKAQPMMEQSSTRRVAQVLPTANIVPTSVASSRDSPRKADDTVPRIATKPQASGVGGGFVQQNFLPQKKDGFVIPKGKPVQTPRKNRIIAPAPPISSSPPSSSPSVHSTYLAQLLTKGAIITSVKKEPVSGQITTTTTTSSSTTTYQPIRPADPTRANIKQPSSPSPGSPAVAVGSLSPAHSPSPGLPIDLTKVPSSFPTSVLIAAASQAFSTISTVSSRDVLSMSPKSSANILTVSPLPQSPPSPQLDLSPRQPPSPLSDVMSPLSGMMSPGQVEVSFGLEPEKVQYHEQRRMAHQSAEQKRRCNLKVNPNSGFDMLHTLVPALSVNPKVSKAAMLQKTADYCKKLKSERSQMQKEAEILKQEIESLNSAISVVQSQLPETGVPVTRQRVDQMKDMFDSYVRSRTLTNWKFWIFSIIIRNLFGSYNNTVSTASIEELCRTVLAWLDQNCSLVALRPTVLNALRHLSTTTSILTEPSRMKEQATQAVTKDSQSSSTHTRS